MWIDNNSTSVSELDLHPLDLVAFKLNITDQEVLDIFSNLFDLQLYSERDETDCDIKRWLMAASLSCKEYCLSENEVPHSAEHLLTLFLDYGMMHLVQMNNECHPDSVKNIIDVILR